VNTKVAGFEVDFHWPRLRRIVEVDGPPHERPTAKRVDARRDARLGAAGWTVLRIPDVEIEHDPQGVTARVLEYLAR
jgi:very-short-patch-repair endonuclease